VKKHKVKKKEEEIEKLALNAERHIAAAQLRLQHQQEQLPLQVFNVTEQVKVSRKVYSGKPTVAITFFKAYGSNIFNISVHIRTLLQEHCYLKLLYMFNFQ
jgi:hypothetical protein